VQGLFVEGTMPQPHLTIGALASQTSINVPTIRYYEDIGLLPKAERAANGHRYYREADLKRLTFIKRCRDFGFPIEQVRELLGLFEDGNRACVEARDIAQTHLDAVRMKLEEMRQLEASLVGFMDSCDEACCTGTISECAMIEDLSAAERVRRTAGARAGCCSDSQR
jgi:DNA-binding transcriptional MerR regulator